MCPKKKANISLFFSPNLFFALKSTKRSEKIMSLYGKIEKLNTTSLLSAKAPMNPKKIEIYKKLGTKMGWIITLCDWIVTHRYWACDNLKLPSDMRAVQRKFFYKVNLVEQNPLFQLFPTRLNSQLKFRCKFKSKFSTVPMGYNCQFTEQFFGEYFQRRNFIGNI